MKWKALIALFVLAATVVVPAAQSVLDDQEINLFIVDEEKGNADGKIFSPTEEHLPAYQLFNFIEQVSHTPFAYDQIPVDRAMELQTPPPDFC